MDGNEAAATIAYLTNEVVAIYPITPASSMGELADMWRSQGRTNLWGQVPSVVEMHSEGGAAGALHGSVQAGALSTTFTSSQGLMLMIPNMFKIAGELTPMVIHVSSRTVAGQGVSIYCEHNDVMACRMTGFGIMFSNNVQEVYDFGLVSQIASLDSRIPFLHAFDGFRTSHEVERIEMPDHEQLRQLVRDEWVLRCRTHALSPERPVLRGSVQNSDVYFQGKERLNPFYNDCPDRVQSAFDALAKVTGRQYQLYEYSGHPEAERVIVLMGSGAETAFEAVERLYAQGEKVGVLKVRLYRPFDAKRFVQSLPKTVKVIGVLDRTKESGAVGEPLFLDVVAAIQVQAMRNEAPFDQVPCVVGGRYGIGGKEFTPAMVKAVFNELAQKLPRHDFTIGIHDDVTHLSLECDDSWNQEPPNRVCAIFWGLGADGTVSANKNTIKILGEETDLAVQGYFVFDSKKSGSVTESHLRFGPDPIHSMYLIQEAHFIGVHQFGLCEVRPVLDRAAPGATVLFNTPYDAEATWNRLSKPIQELVIERGLKLYGIDAYALAREVGLGHIISSIMQTAFFALSDVLPLEFALQKTREMVQRAYRHRGKEAVQQNLRAIDLAVERVFPIDTRVGVTSTRKGKPPLTEDAPPHIQKLIAPMVIGKGDLLPVGAFEPGGTFPIGTSRYEKREISLDAPIWDPDLCTQCGICSFVCPHAVIRAKVATPEQLAAAPEGTLSAAARGAEHKGNYYLLGISAADCTGCAVCVENCPAKDKTNPTRRALAMQPRTDPAGDAARWTYFDSLPMPTVYDEGVRWNHVRTLQYLSPMCEFSGACAGCGETPYLKLATQLFGDRMIVANAAGCSAVFAGSLPTIPFYATPEGRGPAYNFSLFEDNAEFGFGYRLAVDALVLRAQLLLTRLNPHVEAGLVDRLLDSSLSVPAKRQAVHELKLALANLQTPEAVELREIADNFVPRSVWSVGGDGWAYDIGFGGVDHVLASGLDINLLVLDTEVYSNTGGQSSKATSRGAVAKFAAGGKPSKKKDLGRTMIAYGNVYVAQVSMGASESQTIRAFLEAESYPGPSLLICYSHCIAHGIDMTRGMKQQELAVRSGHWPTYRYDPRREAEGKNPFQLDCKAPDVSLEEYLYRENRYRVLKQLNSAEAERLLALAKKDAQERWRFYKAMSEGHLT